MKKIIYYSIVLAILLSSCSLVVKKIARLKTPKVETKKSISDFLIKSKCPFQYNYILKGNKDSSLIFKNIMKSFKNEVLITDSIGIRYCYIGNEKCNGIQFKKAFLEFDKYYQPCEKDTFNFAKFLTTIESIDLTISHQCLNKADYYLVIYWSKFFGGKEKLKEDFEWIKSLKNESKKNITIILVNTDLQATWGLKEGAKMKLKFKFLGKKSGSLEFDDIPYK